jgi:uncharacterized DUF497 family protein
LEAIRSGEYRIIGIGKTSTQFIVMVVYTLRGMIVRLISARQADKEQLNLYLEHKFKNREDENNDS